MNSISHTGDKMEREACEPAHQDEVENRDQQQQALEEADVGIGNGSHMFVFTNEKSGMKEMKSEEKERTNRIIYEMSKNSSYFKQAEMQDKKVDAKVAEMKIKLQSLDKTQKAHLTRQADKAAAEFEGQRNLDNVCMVVDMDMFYAAVEIRDRPELADKPVAVGGNNMISTTNYHARKKGVRSAMPGFIGRKLCPDLVFVNPDFTKYTKVAEVIRDIFREYDPRMRSYSLDEAYLNVTPTLASRLDEEDGLPRQTGQKSTSVSLATAVATQSSAQAVDAHSAEGRLPHQQPCPTPPGALFATPPPPSFSSSSSSFSLSLSPSSLAPATESDCGRGSPVGEGRSQRKNGCWASEDKQQEWASWQRQQQRQRQRRRTQSDLGNRETDEDEEDGDEEDRGGGSSSSSSSNSGGSGIKRGDERRRARMFEAAQAMAEEIRRRIQEATRLTASVGIGPNFMLAKIASDWKKPNGQWCVRGDRAEVLRFMHDLPVRKVGGVGKVTEKCLREAMGVVTCGDLFRERAACMHVMTPHTSRWLLKVSLGIAGSDHDVATEQAQAAGAITRKQISKERTFGELHRPQDLLAKCKDICDSLAAEMATKTLEAKTVGLKIKTVKFHVRTLDHTGQAYVSTSDELYAIASSLLQREIRRASEGGGALRLRLMGVKASSFRGQAGIALLPGQSTLDGFFGSRPRAAGGTEAALAAGSVSVETASVTTQDVGASRAPTVAQVAAQERCDEEVATAVRAALVPASTPTRAWREGTSTLEEGGVLDGGENASTAHDRAANRCPKIEGSSSFRVADSGVHSVVCGYGSEGGAPVLAAERETKPKPSSVIGSSTSAFTAHPRAPRGAWDTKKSRGLWETVRVPHRDKSSASKAMPTVAEPVEAMNCPICGDLLGAVSNAVLNRHIDACVGVCSVPEDRGTMSCGGTRTGSKFIPPAAQPIEAMNCPICGELLGAVSNAALNRHVDACAGVCSVLEGGGNGGGGGGSVPSGPQRSKSPRSSGKRMKRGTTKSIETFMTPSNTG